MGRMVQERGIWEKGRQAKEDNRIEKEEKKQNLEHINKDERQ